MDQSGLSYAFIDQSDHQPLLLLYVKEHEFMIAQRKKNVQLGDLID